MNQQAPALHVWWLIWAAITAAFFLAVGIFETAATPAGTLSWLALMALPPFIASAVIRFGLLPGVTAPPKKFIFFLLGLALAESGGFFALILSLENALGRGRPRSHHHLHPRLHHPAPLNPKLHPSPS
jgi:hypothetical protein